MVAEIKELSTISLKIWLCLAMHSYFLCSLSQLYGIDSGVARAPQAPRPRGGGGTGLKGLARARQGPPGRSSLRNLLARGPNKLLAGGPENRRYATGYR